MTLDYRSQGLSILRNFPRNSMLDIYSFLPGEDSESQRRASQLSAMASEARRLSALKCYQPAEDDLDKSLQQQKNDGGNCDQNPEQGLDQNLENSSVGSGKETADQSPEKKVKK